MFSQQSNCADFYSIEFNYVCYGVFFSPQPHLCDPSLHLDPDSCYFTGPHSYSANHFSAHPPERNPPHCHGNSDSLHFDTFWHNFQAFAIMTQGFTGNSFLSLEKGEFM